MIIGYYWWFLSNISKKNNYLGFLHNKNPTDGKGFISFAISKSQYSAD